MGKTMADSSSVFQTLLAQAIVASNIAVQASAAAQAAALEPWNIIPGITPMPSTTPEAFHLFSTTACKVYRVTSVNLTSVPGWLCLLDRASIPADGAITPFATVRIDPYATAEIAYGLPPAQTITGLVAVLTEAADCFTQATTVIRGFLSAQIGQ